MILVSSEVWNKSMQEIVWRMEQFWIDSIWLLSPWSLWSPWSPRSPWSQLFLPILPYPQKNNWFEQTTAALQNFTFFQCLEMWSVLCISTKVFFYHFCKKKLDCHPPPFRTRFWTLSMCALTTPTSEFEIKFQVFLTGRSCRPPPPSMTTLTWLKLSWQNSFGSF